MDSRGTTRAANAGSTEVFGAHYNIIEQFKNAMQEVGIVPPETIVADGTLQRFKIDGKLSGAYKLHLDGRPAGYFQDFKQGVKETWKAAGGYVPLSQLQKELLAKKKMADERARLESEQSKHQAAAENHGNGAVAK